MDVFASEATALCRRFLIPGDSDDPYADLGSAEGADALKMIWVREERLWAHPPRQLLQKLVGVLEAPNCTAEVLVCCPDEHEVRGPGQKGGQHFSPEWYTRLLALSDDHVFYPPGELRKVAPDAPADVDQWPVCVFRLPPKHRFLHRRNALVKLDGDPVLDEATVHGDGKAGLVVTQRMLEASDWTGIHARNRKPADMKH